MTSAAVTFGVTGVAGTVTAGVGIQYGQNYGSALSTIDLLMYPSGSSMSSGVSYYGCIGTAAYASYGCTGLGTSPSVTETFYSGEVITLEAGVFAESMASGLGLAIGAGNSASASVTVDPLYLDLPPGATFSAYSTIPGFLAPVPVPGTLALLASGLLGLGWTIKRKNRRGEQPRGALDARALPLSFL
jgi:hypothetical protein